MFNSLLFVFLFFLPAGIANMAPVFVARIPGLRNWNAPIDGGAVWRGNRVLGDNKTWRGFVVGILAAIIITGIIFVIVSKNVSFVSIFPENYINANPILLGLLLGAGSLVGDSVESFFKRQLGISSGKSWFPFDQLDYIIGAIAFTFFYVPLRPAQYLALLALGFILHIIIAYIGYLTNIREQAI